MSEPLILMGVAGDATSMVDGTGPGSDSGSAIGVFNSSTVAGTASTLYVKRSLSGYSWSKTRIHQQLY